MVDGKRSLGCDLNLFAARGHTMNNTVNNTMKSVDRNVALTLPWLHKN